MAEAIVLENWCDIPGYEGLYQVSNAGKVKSLPRSTVIRHPAKTYIRNSKERLLRQCLCGDGYPFVGLSSDGVVSCKMVHRLVAEAFIGQPPEGAVCNHKNGNRCDNRLENLEWTTQRENIRHSIEVLGNQFCGERNGMARLTQADVDRIRESHKCGESMVSISERCGLHYQTVYKIVRRKRWR